VTHGDREGEGKLVLVGGKYDCSGGDSMGSTGGLGSRMYMMEQEDKRSDISVGEKYRVVVAAHFYL
jgi:hypothetical protein